MQAIIRGTKDCDWFVKTDLSDYASERVSSDLRFARPSITPGFTQLPATKPEEAKSNLGERHHQKKFRQGMKEMNTMVEAAQSESPVKSLYP